MTRIKNSNDNEEMRKINFFLLAIAILAAQGLAQNEIKFAWFANPKLDSAGSDFIAELNALETEGAAFVLLTGKITSGKNIFTSLKKAIDRVDFPVKVLPTNSDLSDFETSASFYDNFEEKRFLLKKGNSLFIGLSSQNAFAPEVGLFAREDLLWLEDELQSLPDSLQVFLFTDFQPSEIVNFYEFERLLKNDFFETVFLPEKPKGISTKYYFIYPNGENAEAKCFLTSRSISVRFEGGKEFVQHFKKPVARQVEPKVELFSLNDEKLKELWRQSVSSSLFAKALIYKGRIYTAQNDGLLSCFERDGSLLWDYDLFGDVKFAPVAMDGYVIAATLQGDLILLNALSGDALQTIGFENAITSPLLVFEYKWEVNTMSPKTSGSKAAVVFGSADGVLRCYDAETLEKIWETKVGNFALSNPLYQSGNQIFTVAGKSLLAFDKKNGALLWRKRFAEKPVGEIAVGRADIFVIAERKIYSIDGKLGNENWVVKKVTPRKISLSRNRKTLYVINTKGNLVLLESYSGKFKKSFPLKLKGKRYEIFALGKTLFVAGREKVYRINKRGRYTEILASKIPLSSATPFGKKEILFANINGDVILCRYIGD